MKARVAIFMVIGVGLVVYHFTIGSAPKVRVATPGRLIFEEDPHDIDMRQKLVRDYPAPGNEPPEPVELSVQVWTDPDDGKNRLYYEINEAHGYYVDTLDLEFWYKDDDEVTGPENSPLIVPVHLNKYLEANDTLRGHVEVVWAELQQVGGRFGTTENWDARVVHYHRARLKTPPALLEHRAP